MGWLISDLLDAPSRFHGFGPRAMNGWLPHGPILAAAMTAVATGSPLRGVDTMLLFRSATIPVPGMRTGQMAVRALLFLHRVGAAVILLIASQLALRGLAVFGIAEHPKFGEFVIW